MAAVRGTAQRAWHLSQLRPVHLHREVPNTTYASARPLTVVSVELHPQAEHLAQRYADEPSHRRRARHVGLQERAASSTKWLVKSAQHLPRAFHALKLAPTRSRSWLISLGLLHETSLAVLGPQDGPDQPRQHEGGSTKAWSSAEPLELAP